MASRDRWETVAAGLDATAETAGRIGQHVMGAVFGTGRELRTLAAELFELSRGTRGVPDDRGELEGPR